jgi:L-alanine-DL-glutamate epimerase-like enolase superfamily enzyme
MMMTKATDVRPISARLRLLPVQTRLPLKFGSETLTHITCARAGVRVVGRDGRQGEGWGETPLSVQWAWPSCITYQERYDAMEAFCRVVAEAFAGLDVFGHAIEVGHAFLEESLPRLLEQFNRRRADREAMPHLAALICASPFDIALHDAYGVLNGVPTYDTYKARFMNLDLAAMLEPAEKEVSFVGRFPEDYLVKPRKDVLPAWHLVGGKDWLEEADKDAPVPDDGYPSLLREWIRADGLNCLKVKLRGNDAAWDYRRLAAVGRIAIEEAVDWLSADFNCMVTDVAYVNEILDRLMIEHPRVYGMILYVEQPFPYDLEAHRIDVHSVSARKPLFMDESAHNWRLIKLGRGLGWTGVALKTCKTQTGALLSLCWAKAHGMTLMVQDLTNPTLAQIPHVLLAAHAGTIMGVETNAMQFYPEASKAEARVHPGLYVRRNGMVRLDTLSGPGFGYRMECDSCPTL